MKLHIYGENYATFIASMIYINLRSVGQLLFFMLSTASRFNIYIYKSSRMPCLQGFNDYYKPQGLESFCPVHYKWFSSPAAAENLNRMASLRLEPSILHFGFDPLDCRDSGHYSSGIALTRVEAWVQLPSFFLPSSTLR